ncbi:IS110 family transposase [Pedococcus sp. 5OH_020]|uniref:IS110 family transposase n=1 Tax=Pedococcus sp. 5OH_020 TaxID=2989814 RepID=UPI0022EA07FB|nr:IS110 family transposase [Pedococcus sp. 5OH_020]
MNVFCGIDWAEDHHDIALVDREGQLLARQRISDDVAGLTTLMSLLAEHGDAAGDPIPVAIETPRGLLTACLRATARRVYPINPMAVARYRDRHSIAGRKSDHGDAVVLANILRTDAHTHRTLPADSELVQAIAVLARAQQDAVWARTTAHNKLRSHLREYYPSFLAAFADARGGINRAEARVILAAASHPAAAAKLTNHRLVALLKRAGRSRGIAAEAARLSAALRTPQMRQLPLVEQAMGRQAIALLGQLDAACTAADDLEQAVVEAFEQHPDARIITSFPGLALLTGARVLAEVGDDRARFHDPKGLKAYAGAAPITRASGKSTTVLHRRVKNNRLNAAGYTWAFSALTASPGARTHYDRRRQAGDRHAAAQRNLFARLLGCLHHCLQTGQPYREQTAFPRPTTTRPTVAA